MNGRETQSRYLRLYFSIWHVKPEFIYTLQFGCALLLTVEFLYLCICLMHSATFLYKLRNISPISAAEICSQRSYQLIKITWNCIYNIIAVDIGVQIYHLFLGTPYRHILIQNGIYLLGIKLFWYILVDIFRNLRAANHKHSTNLEICIRLSTKIVDNFSHLKCWKNIG
jgi:hypothetical protein